MPRPRFPCVLSAVFENDFSSRRQGGSASKKDALFENCCWIASRELSPQEFWKRHSSPLFVSRRPIFRSKTALSAYEPSRFGAAAFGLCTGPNAESLRPGSTAMSLCLFLRKAMRKGAFCAELKVFQGQDTPISPTRGWYEDSGGKAHQNDCANNWVGQCQADWNKEVSLENPRLSIRTLEQRLAFCTFARQGANGVIYLRKVHLIKQYTIILLYGRPCGWNSSHLAVNTPDTDESRCNRNALIGK